MELVKQTLKQINFLRYPGSKRRIFKSLVHYLPPSNTIKGRFVDPFVGGGIVFFSMQYKNALLSDLNKDLIDLYRGIQIDPIRVWEKYSAYPETKKCYYQTRDAKVDSLGLIERAAKTLYLNRTCFKGMWRYNAEGKFNVGYGGQDRRWAINKEDLMEISRLLRGVQLLDGDFEMIVDQCRAGDFIFIDPPYQPGQREMGYQHYLLNSFTYKDHVRLQEAISRASHRGVLWVMTTSSHPDITNLFKDCMVICLPKDPHKRLHNIEDSGEVLIRQRLL